MATTIGAGQIQERTMAEKSRFIKEHDRQNGSGRETYEMIGSIALHESGNGLLTRN